MEDFSKVIKKHNKKYELKYKQNTPNAFQHPFRACLVGGSGCGKTSLLLHCLFNDQHKANFQRVYIFGRDIEEPCYRYLRDKLEDVEKVLKASYNTPDDFFVYKISNNLKDLEDPNLFDSNYQNLVVIDDMVGEGERAHDTVKKHFLMGRKRNCSYFYLTQSYYACPKMIRLNCTYFCLFTLNSRREIQLITREFCSDIEPETFQQVFHEATKDPYTWLMIDTTAGKDLNKKYRRMFDGYGVFKDGNEDAEESD